MIRTGRLIVLLTVAMLVLAGCFSGEPKVAEEDQVGADQAAALDAEASGTPAPGSSPGAGGGGESLEFVAVDLDFEQAPDTAPAGQLTFALDNQGSAVHNVVIEETGETVVEAAGGEAATGTTTLDAGTYTYFCDIPGHRGAGMEGTLEVQ